VLLVAAVGGVDPRQPLARDGRSAVKGPDVVLVPGVAAFLFCTGALGVLIRRSPLIVLLSLEIMLNGANLALIAFSRTHGTETARSSRSTVMAVAASEVVVGSA
jgi:NADH:ubiquinone oxidoreductase subunit K